VERERARAEARAGVPAAVLLDVDVAGPIPDVSGRDDEGNRQEQVWVLGREHGRPVTLVSLDVPEPGLSAEAVRAALPEAGAAPAPAVGPGEGPDVTVVICTRERPTELRRALESLVQQTDRSFRTVVVDNAPRTGATREVVAGFSAELTPEYLVEPRPGLSRARNAAVNAVPAGVVAWLDDDEEGDTRWVAEIRRAFVTHPGAAAVSGVVIPAELRTRAQVWFEQFGGHSKGRGFTPELLDARSQHPLFPLPAFGVGANMAFPVEALRAVGGFDEALGAGTATRGGEDTKVFSQLLMAGGSVVYWPPAMTRHYHRADLAGLESQLTGYGTGLTAYYAAMIADDPRNLVRLARLAPTAARALFGGDSLRVATVGADFPQHVLGRNRRAMLAGPLLYVRERLRGRRS
jgi:GT2 family glycosyltransferase